MVLQQAVDVLTIPEAVIEWQGDSTFVYVLTAEEPEQKFDRKNIETGLSDGVNIEVRGGIDKDVKLRGNVIEEEQ